MIVINEINYNSNNDFDSGDWVELYNHSNLDVDISQWQFLDSDDSHVFIINDGVTLGSGEFLVLCRDSSDFSQVYPGVQNFIGETDFGFSNGGELLRLLDNNGGLVDFVSYDDSAPWPVEADGGGVTLELLNPTLDNNSFESWAVSAVELGTPGQQNSSFDALSNDANELLPSVFALHQNYPNPFNPRTRSVHLSNPKSESNMMCCHLPSLDLALKSLLLLPGQSKFITKICAILYSIKLSTS